MAGPSDVALNIILTDDNEPAGKLSPPPGVSPRATLGGETPDEVRESGGGSGKEPTRIEAFGAKVEKWGDNIVKATTLLEKFSVSLAGNDSLGTFKTGVAVASEALSYLGKRGEFAGELLGKIAGPVLAVTGAFSNAVGAFIERGKQLEQYSPRLTFSNAMAEVKSTFADMREAQELGSGIGRSQDAMAELTIMFRDTVLPIKKFIVEVLATILEALVKLAKDGYVAVVDIWHILEKFPEILTAAADYLLSGGTRSGLFESIATTLRMEGKATRDAIARAAKKDEPFDELMVKMLQDIVNRGGMVPVPNGAGGPF